MRIIDEHKFRNGNRLVMEEDRSSFYFDNDTAKIEYLCVYFIEIRDGLEWHTSHEYFHPSQFDLATKAFNRRRSNNPHIKSASGLFPKQIYEMNAKIA